MTKKNYYVALRFKGRPELHMTVSYHKSLDPEGVAALIQEVSDHMEAEPRGCFRMQLDMQAWFGPHHTVRVLEPRYSRRHWPEWLYDLAPDQWHPHVTCSDKKLDLKVIAVSVMTKKTEIARWDLH